MAETLGWRAAFLFVGLPGLALALVVRLTLREPPRGHSEARRDAGPAPEPMVVVRAMWRLATFRHLATAATLHAFVGYGVTAWNAAFLIRTHGMSVGEVGTWLAGIAIVAGGLGTFTGGYLADRLTPRDVRWNLWVPGVATLVAVPFAVSFYLWSDVRVALALAGIPVFFGAMYLGPTFAITQALAPLRMRAVASAFLLFLINLIGLGLGPQVVGIASDLLAPHPGRELAARLARDDGDVQFVVGAALLPRHPDTEGRSRRRGDALTGARPLESRRGYQRSSADRDSERDARLRELLDHGVAPETDRAVGVRDPAVDVLLDVAGPAVAELDREIAEPLERRLVPRPERLARSAHVPVAAIRAGRDPHHGDRSRPPRLPSTISARACSMSAGSWSTSTYESPCTSWPGNSATRNSIGAAAARAAAPTATRTAAARALRIAPS